MGRWRTPSKLTAFLAVVLAIGTVGIAVGHSTGIFHYHTNIIWTVQMKGVPNNPVNGRYGIHSWQYINPSTSPLGTGTDSSGWIGFTANGSSSFTIQFGHGRETGNIQDLFAEVFAPITVRTTCLFPGGGTGFGSQSCFTTNYAYYGVPTEGWYQATAGDVFVDGRWQLELRINDVGYARIDWDNYGGISGLHQVAEARNGQGRTLQSLYDAPLNMRWGSSFAGFEVATGTNGVVGPFEQVPSGVTLNSAIWDQYNTQFGRVGCSAPDPGGNGHVVQAAQWLGGWPTSHAHGSSPPIGGNCYPDGTSFP